MPGRTPPGKIAFGILSTFIVCASQAATSNVSLCFEYYYACRWHQCCQIQNNGDFGVLPFLGSSQTSNGLTVLGRYASLRSLSIKMLIPDILNEIDVAFMDGSSTRT
jgi:hypothetical protein